jgi:hypothetical protein
MTSKELLNLHTKLEPLCDDLKPFIFPGPTGNMIHHPLVIELFFDPERSARVNSYYQHKKEKRAECEAEGKWGQYIFIHERPYRLEALCYAMRNYTNLAADYWAKLIGEVWVDSENIHQHQGSWINLWMALNEPRLAMDAEDAAVFKQLPERFTVYRGISNPRFNPDGLSWTTDKDRALWFANRKIKPKQHKPTLITGMVEKREVLACFNGRGENEIVVPAELVANKRKSLIRISAENENQK